MVYSKAKQKNRKVVGELTVCDHGSSKNNNKSNKICKVEFNQPSYWLYSVPNLLVFQHLVTLFLGGFVVRVVSEIKC